jgi:hypothetical protein
MSKVLGKNEVAVLRDAGLAAGDDVVIGAAAAAASRSSVPTT